MQMHQVLLKALITEKSTKEGEQGRYTFLVARRADKKDIRYAVEQLFKVNVVQILTVTIKGRTHRIGKRRSEVTLSPFKKAIIRLKAGQSLGSSEEEKGKEKAKEEGKSAKGGFTFGGK